eukprot:1158701-Pelagomonas_calceolata.AAC.2
MHFTTAAAEPIINPTTSYAAPPHITRQQVNHKPYHLTRGHAAHFKRQQQTNHKPNTCCRMTWQGSDSEVLPQRHDWLMGTSRQQQTNNQFHRLTCCCMMWQGSVSEVFPQWHGRLMGTSQGGQGPMWQPKGHM